MAILVPLALFACLLARADTLHRLWYETPAYRISHSGASPLSFLASPPPLAIFRLPNVSCFHSFWTPISWPFLSRFQYPGIQPRPSALVDNSPGGRGVLPYIAYTGMCRPTGSWFWSSWLRTGYPFQRRFLERGIKNCRSRLYVLLKIVAVYEEAFTWCISRTNKEISF